MDGPAYKFRSTKRPRVRIEIVFCHHKINLTFLLHTYRTPTWFQINEAKYDTIWSPEIVYSDIVSSESIPPYGRNKLTENFWAQLKNGTAIMTYYEYQKVTIACDFGFQTFPFDSHECHLDFGFHQSTFGSGIRINPIKVLNNDTSANLLTEEKHISNRHLPYTFSILKTKKEFPKYNYEFYAPYAGIVLQIKRESLDLLIGTFYVPTAIFSALSMVSFFINPDLVSACIQ